MKATSLFLRLPKDLLLMITDDPNILELIFLSDNDLMTKYYSNEEFWRYLHNQRFGRYIHSKW